MRKDHLRSPVLFLLSALIILCLLAAGSAYAARERAVGPLLPINGLSAITGDPAARPIIGHTLPTPPIMMGTAQGSGPDADENLTATGTGSRELYPNASPGAIQNRVVFCSDGQDLDGDGRIDAELPLNPDLDLWIMRSDGSEQYKVRAMPGDQVDPVYDPGGRLICFSSQVNGIYQIFTIEVRDPSILTQITSGPGNKRHPTWSPDSNWISFQSDVNRNWDIYKIISNGAGSPIQLTFGPSNDTDPAWSTTGFEIAFTRETGGVSRIYSVTPDGADIEQLSNGGGDATANDKEPAWRQNSTELAFASSRFTGPGDTVSDFNIWRMPSAGEVSGAIPTVVSNTSIADTADDTDPTWTVEIDRAPTRICFTSERTGTRDVWAMQLRDWIPPILEALPSVNPRLATPGDDVEISVPVYDRDSGVAQVRAYIKDPDLKTYLESSGSFDAGTGFNGQRSLELDCTPVGQTELLDDDGDGTFTGTWTTQSISSGRDYIVDILVVDVAGNSQIYDDVYGFSTHMFAPRHNILFVDDYCEGQLFLAQLGWNNDFAASWPVESYYTSNPSFVPGLEGTIDFDSIRDAYGDGYDTWRVICRGAIPSQVYQYYLPTIEHQLDPAKLDETGSVGITADRQVPVADRAVIWAAPHTGNVWIAPGGIMDASTQADVALFVQRGGRLFMSGEDIAWALTMNGTRTNTFLSTTLRARFVSDTVFSGATITETFAGRTFRIQRTSVGFDVVGLAGDVVAADPWGSGHPGDLGTDNWLDDGDNPLAINTSWNRVAPPGEPDYHDCAAWSVRPDAIAVLDAVQIYTARPGTLSTPSLPVGLRYRSTSPTEGSVVFLSAGFEQFNRGYHTPSPLPSHCRNVRSHLLHNALCWSRTGGFQGRVISITDGGKAVNDPAPIVSAKQGGVVRYAVRCQHDGTYVMQGLPPGHYDIEAVRPGYEIDHYDGEYVHGGQIARTVDFAIKRAQPGAVTGRVTSAATGEPLANVEVSIAVPDDFTGTPPSLPAPVRTAADGTYTLPYVPTGDYNVTADGTDILYGTDTQPATVQPGDTTTVDFALGAADGALVATVRNVEDNSPIRNAQISIRDAVGNRQLAYTDDAGLATVDLSPGSYNVSASASGFKASAEQPVTVSPAETVSLAFALEQEEGGTIVGRVVTAGTGMFIGGVTIRVFFGDEEIASTVSSNTAVTTVNGVPYNYQLTNVNTGEVRVMAQLMGFTPTPTEQTVLVQSAQTTRDVNFAMDSLHTFPRGLQLVSFPWDYSLVDPAALLGIGSNTWKMATWDAARQAYRLYPEAPADRFRLGVGYWMNLSAPADLSQEGTVATDPVELPLGAGWNLVGCPYNRRVDFYTASVRDAAGTVRPLQQAMAQGIIGSGLYAYVLGGYQTVGVMTPYIGYWLKTNMPCSLILSESAGALSSGRPEPDATPRVDNGWLLQLRTHVAGVQDTATYLGWSRDATAGCDFGLDQYKPPVPAMGPYVYAAIDNRDWANNGGDYAVDVRPADIAATWNVTVHSNQVGERVTISWDDLSRLPNTVRPVMIDLQTGRRVYMRTSSGYTFEATDQPRRLQVQVAPAGVGQLAITPQAAQQASGAVAISYTLSRAANVEVVITNIAGRTVRHLGNAQPQPAGLNTVLWDGRDKAGLQTPSGRYLVTVIGRTETGQECRAVMPLQRTR